MSADKLTDLADAVTAVRADYDKAVAGNKAATTRVRKAMMAIRNAAQDIRKTIGAPVVAAAPAKAATKAKK